MGVELKSLTFGMLLQQQVTIYILCFPLRILTTGIAWKEKLDIIYWDPSSSEQLFPSLMSQESLGWTKYDLGISPPGSENTLLKVGRKNYLGQGLI